MPLNRKRKAGVVDAPEMKPKHERGEFDVVSQEEVDEIMKNYDPESNVRIWSGWQEYAVKGILAAFSVYTIYVTLFATLLDQVRLPSFVGLGILMGYLVYPARKGKQKINHIPWYDWIIMILGTAAFFYFVFNAQAIIKQGIYFAWYEYVIGAIGILALAELCRRSVGIPILCVAAFFVCYALYFFSQKLGFLGALKTMIYRLFYTTTGIFTTPIDVCSKYIAVFIIFGAFLERTGISDFFIQLANSLAGSASGGPAKVAVISSALCGMVSGSSVGNTVTTGSVTIPMMKKTGYRPEFAGAVEAAASTGGQIMPPVMGAAAFLMIDYVGVPYSSIIVRAILPAVLYFMGIFIAVHLEAKRTGLRGIPKDQLPVFSKLIKKAYLLLPLIILVVMVSMNLKTMAFSAATAIVACIVVSLFNKENRITPMKFFDALANGGKSCISIIAACGIAGCVAGCIAMTGLASQIISFIIRIAGDKLIIALFFTMLCCIVLGMGVPTTANYCIMASTCAPIRHRGGHHPARGLGCLRRLGYRQVRPHEDRRQRHTARHSGVHRALHLRHGSHHDVCGRRDLVSGGPHLHHLRHRHLRRGLWSGGLHLHQHGLVHAYPGHRGRPDAAGTLHLDRYRGPGDRGRRDRPPVPAFQEAHRHARPGVTPSLRAKAGRISRLFLCPGPLGTGTCKHFPRKPVLS